MRLPNNAISIANAVKIPKYIVGKKFEKTKIEKPAIIVYDVFLIAIPTVRLHSIIDLS